MSDQHPTPWYKDFMSIKLAYYIYDANDNYIFSVTDEATADHTVAAVNACAALSNINVDEIDKLKKYRLMPAMLMCSQLDLIPITKLLSAINSVAFGVHRIMFIVKSLLPDSEHFTRRERV